MNTFTSQANFESVVSALLGNPPNAAYKVLTELIYNSFDALRLRHILDPDFTPDQWQIAVNYDRRRNVFSVADNGRGFLGKDVQAFISAFCSAKGGEGTHGRWGFGRNFSFLFAENMKVRSVSPEFTKGISFDFSRGDLIKALESKVEKRPKTNGVTIDWTDGFGSCVELQDIQWTGNGLPREDTVFRNLHEWLSPRVARITTLNGNPLPDRALASRPLERMYGADDLNYFAESFGGSAEVYVYMPLTRKEYESGIYIGGYGRILLLKDFVRGLSPDLQRGIQPILLSGELTGEILIPSVNDYRGNDSSSLDPAIYQDGLGVDIVGFLTNVVGPWVAKEYAKHQTAQRRQEFEGALQQACDDLNPEDFDPTKIKAKGMLGKGKENGDKQPRPKADWQINVTPSYVRLMPGDTQFIRLVSSRGCSGNFKLNTKGSGGSLQAIEGGWQYTAGRKVGSFSFTISDTDDSAKIKTVNVEIVAEREMDITPSSVEVPQGGVQRFRIRHPNMLPDNAKVTWTMDDKSEGISVVRGDGGMYVDVQVPAQCKVGTYDLTASTKELTSTAQVVVVKPEPQPLLLLVDDRVYQVRAATTRQSAFVTLITDEHTPEGVDGFLSVDDDHHILKQAQERPAKKRGEYWFADLLVRSTVVGYVAHKASEGVIDPTGMPGEVDRILGSMLKK